MENNSFYHAEWDYTARKLDKVKSLDYPAAYHAAYGGSHVLSARKSESAREMLDGRSAALAVWTQVQAIRV